MLLLASLQAWGQRLWLVSPDGKPHRLEEALRLAADGDTIELASGDYHAPSAVIGHRRLTLRGATPRPRLLAAGQSAEGKAIWVVRGGEIRIDNLEFRGARVPDRNGAGIRLERGKLWLRGCAFIDNEMGLMTANAAGIELHIEDSVFEQAVRSSTPLAHLLYVGSIDALSVRGSRFQRGDGGHLIKSRAQRSWLGYNLVADGPLGRASYEIELPNGGDATLIGNIVVQGPASQNPALIAYGAEGPRWPVNRLQLVHNTLVNEQLRPAHYLKFWPERLRVQALVVLNNLSVGAGRLDLPDEALQAGNLHGRRMLLRDPAAGDYRLRDPVAASAQVRLAALGALQPEAEFRWPSGTRAVAADAGPALPGALQR